MVKSTRFSKAQGESVSIFKRLWIGLLLAGLLITGCQRRPPTVTTGSGDAGPGSTGQTLDELPTQPANLRQGPGTEYGLAGAFNVGEVGTITGKNDAGDWLQVVLNTGATGWVYAPLVTTRALLSVGGGGYSAAPAAGPLPAAPAPPSLLQRAGTACGDAHGARRPISAQPHFTMTSGV
jgi:hypothetical protein